MYRKFVNARSPLRLLEKGLHGGLGVGNVGALLAGHGVGKSSFLIGVALDELLRGGTVLHVTLDQTVSHVRDYYDTVFEALAASTHLDDPARIRAEVDTRRRIRAYADADFNASKLADAVKIESESGARPTLIVIDGVGVGTLEREDMAGVRALAQELAAEIWFAVRCDDELIDGIPEKLRRCGDHIGVVLALEPKGHEVTLRALKDHENENLQNLHVGLDPNTLLLIRS